MRLGLYHDADLHCGTVLENEFGLSLLRNLIMILANKTSGSVRPKSPIVQFNKTRTQSPAQPFYSLRLLLLGTLRSEDGDGRENVAEKVNSLSFNPHRDYSESLTLSNVGEPS